MTKSQFLIEIESLLENAKTAILATVDRDGSPRMRWMTPAILKDRAGAIYAVTSLDFDKRRQLEANASVQWMFQNKGLDRIAYADGKANLIENASMRAEVLEEIGSKLGVFWKLNSDAGSLVVVETIIERGRSFLPMTGESRIVDFN
ncbi:pyridoxamine 5'-phosphate oxidase family protein [Sediminispirochaeta bajacaliforniensis]|jgi:pyridoxamine 5'-phosphate oxidase|uniref:pyridoxamine 5'-phosphate oxidase family protein n=1 Tax=Sediminispirochaeta bajacaliforniensis TaxID=148 RepID=UPI000367BC65|nr:pyridoxamine 5'-phosphate oxidase family protein [Sediminispirochaeta bajacaliforniensis]